MEQAGTVYALVERCFDEPVGPELAERNRRGSRQAALDFGGAYQRWVRHRAPPTVPAKEPDELRPYIDGSYSGPHGSFADC